MNNIDKLAKALVDSTEIKEKKKTSPYYTSAKVVKVEGDTAWVSIEGGVEQTPARMVVNARAGEDVRVHVAGGNAYVTGNETSPPTDDSYAKKAEEQALRATKAADHAVSEAETAHRAADGAVKDASVAHTAATNAQADAKIAKESAESAVVDAGIAKDMANDATTYAEAANVAATEAVASAESAVTSANNAESFAQSASDYASSALTSAESAVKSANAATYQLSEVEQVLGVVNWLAEHATYTQTEDTVVTEGKWYFTKEGDNYVVGTPVSNPHDEGFYEATIDEAVSNYIATHLYLDGENGLYVRMDKDNGAKLQLTGTGIYLWNTEGEIIAEYSNSVILGDKGGAHITLSPENGLGFYQGAEDEDDPDVNRVAYINESKLFIDQAKLTGSLRIGQFLWKVRQVNTYGDRISLRYEPE